MSDPLKEIISPVPTGLVRGLDGVDGPLRFLDSVIEALPDMVFVKDAETLRFVRFNRAGEELLGFARSELIGKSDYDFFPKEQADYFTKRDRAVLAGREVVEIPEEPILTRHQGTRILHTKKIPLFANDGTPAFLVGLSEDITARKQEQDRRARFLAEAGLMLMSSLDYQATLTAIAKLTVPALADWCTVTITKEDGSIERATAAHRNPEMTELVAKLLEYAPKKQMADAGVNQAIATGTSQLVELVTEEKLRATSTCDEHFEILKRLGPHSALFVPIPGRSRIHGVIALVSGESGRVFNRDDLSLAEELGRRVGMAIENALLYQKAQSAVGARDEFLSIASHELKTPITSMKLHTELSRRRLESDPSPAVSRDFVAKIIDTAERQIDRLVHLVDDLLDITRITSGKLSLRKEDVDLGLLAREVMDRFEGQIRAAGCRYRLQQEGGVMGHWDRYRVEQVLTNLISNAVKYGARSPIEVSVLQEGDLAVIRVSDHGIGISPDNLGKIFQRFERAAAPKSVSGLGLGLYICRQIVEAHNGTIRVESEPQAGTTFTVELPLR